MDTEVTGKKLSGQFMITIPDYITSKLKIQSDDVFNIATDHKNRIVLTKTVPSCIFCSSIGRGETLIEHCSKFVCRSCLMAINEHTKHKKSQ